MSKAELRPVQFVNISGLDLAQDPDNVRAMSLFLSRAPVLAFVSSSTQAKEGSIANNIASSVGGPRFWLHELRPIGKSEKQATFNKRVLRGFKKGMERASYQDGGRVGFLVDPGVANAIVGQLTGHEILIPEGAVVSLRSHKGKYNTLQIDTPRPTELMR